MPRKLFDIDVDEITLCESAANRKKFFIKKMEDKMEEFIKDLKKFMAADEEEGDEEKAITEEEIKKAEKLEEDALKAIKGALNILNKYKADMPDDVLKAIQTLAKYASYGYPAKKEDIIKAGASLSKATREQIQKALEYIKESPKAVALLKTLLGLEVQKEGDNGDEELSPETQAKLEKLAEFERLEKEHIEKEAKDKTKKDEDEKTALLKRIETLEKKKGIKKSIDDPGDKDKGGAGDEEKDEEDKWPSIPIPQITGPEED